MTPPTRPSPNTASALTLSSDDVERLLVEETPDARIAVIKKIAEGHNHHKYSLRELSIAEQIFRLLLRDTEVSVRETMALVLKDNPRLPRDIILGLARDVDSVAVPVIESSEVLTDEDLIALIESARKSQKTEATAKRKQVSKEVAKTIVEADHLQAITTLMKNPGAEVGDEAYQRIVHNYAKHREVMDAIAARPELPMTVVEKIITLVSDTLADKLRKQYKLSAAAISQETEKTREIATLRMLDGYVEPHEIEKLVDQLHLFGRLTSSIILASLCRGNLYFFEVSLAKLSNIPIRNAQMLIHDKGGLGFRALCTKAGFPDKLLTACKYMLETIAEMHRSGQHRGTLNYSDLVVQNLLAKTSGQNVENLSYIVALVRQHA